jgi:hypothetical protein
VIDQTFATQDRVMVESLGAGKGFRGFYQSLATKYRVKMIRVFAELPTCLERVKTRSSTAHIPVSDDMMNLVRQAKKPCHHLPNAGAKILEWRLTTPSHYPPIFPIP